MYSSSPPHNGLRSPLIILAVEDTAYLQDRGRGGVQRVLHYKEERKVSPLFVFYLAMKYVLYSLSSISQIDRLLHHKDKAYDAYSIARRR